MMEFALLDFVSQCPLRLEAASCGHPRGLTDGVYLLYFHFLSISFSVYQNHCIIPPVQGQEEQVAVTRTFEAASVSCRPLWLARAVLGGVVDILP